MHPAQYRLVRTPYLDRPAGGTRSLTAYHVQGEKSFPRPWMLSFRSHSPQIRQRLAPFLYIWPNHVYPTLLADELCSQSYLEADSSRKISWFLSVFTLSTQCSLKLSGK